MKFIIDNISKKDFTDKKIKKEKIISEEIIYEVETIKINSLEELINFQEKSNNPIILGLPHFPESNLPCITIYDGFF